MLAYLEGKIAAQDLDSVIVAVGGIGYRVAISRALGEVGDSVRVFLYEVIREDRYDLYGFASRDELAMFEKLLTIDGVGPKMAQKILAAGTLDTVRTKIQSGDLAFLTSISGVGKKTAQKIILELKGVLVGDEVAANPVDMDVVDALQGLGYSKADIDPILSHLHGDNAEARIKAALQMLGKRK